MFSRFMRTHSKQQGWDRSAARDVDHGQQTREMAFPCPSEKQPERQNRRQLVLRAEPAGARNRQLKGGGGAAGNTVQLTVEAPVQRGAASEVKTQG